MPHKESQISMKPLCSTLLLRPVDFIFVICLTKFLSWLMGSSLVLVIFFANVSFFLLCKFIYECVIEFWVVS